MINMQGIVRQLAGNARREKEAVSHSLQYAEEW